MSEVEAYKRQAAIAALDRVKDGMLVGLGSGSTAAHVLRELSLRRSTGALPSIRGVPTSEATAALARGLGIPLVELGPDGVDVAIDGMDEVGPDLHAIKGLGGALTREKVVAAAAREFVLVGDHGKAVARLGERSPVPVEVLTFGWAHTAQRLADLGVDAVLRLRGQAPVITDNGHLLVDCRLPATFDAAATRAFADAVDRLPGVICHGLFLGMAQRAYLAGPTGVEVLTATPGR